MIWVASASALSIFFFFLGRRKRVPEGIQKLVMLDEDGGGAEVAPSPVTRRRLFSAFLELPYRITPVSLRDRIAARIVPLCSCPGVTVESLYGAGVWVTLGLPSAVLLLTGFSISGRPGIPAGGVPGSRPARAFSSTNGARDRARFFAGGSLREAVREVPCSRTLLAASVSVGVGEEGPLPLSHAQCFLARDKAEAAGPVARSRGQGASEDACPAGVSHSAGLRSADRGPDSPVYPHARLLSRKDGCVIEVEYGQEVPRRT
jgi:hypothetical protein